MHHAYYRTGCRSNTGSFCLCFSTIIQVSSFLRSLGHCYHHHHHRHHPPTPPTTTTTTTTHHHHHLHHHHHHHHHHPFPQHGGPLFPDCTFTVSPCTPTEPSLCPNVPSLYPTVLSLYPHCILPVTSLYPNWTLTVSSLCPNLPSLYPHCTPLYSHCTPTVSFPVPSMYPPSLLLLTLSTSLLAPLWIWTIMITVFTAIILVVERSIIIGSPVIVGWPWLYNIFAPGTSG